ncbi:hypothetical protein FIU89_09655 [Roseovarius sp. THAF27]|nr:hypothetical protein [Roseovarius sp. THAF27]QFT80872.1 hypothetical protein FIU89_09655 [Roseovarius sp. THAF27]
MAKKTMSVRGVTAPSVRPTAYAAWLVAVALSVPVFVVLSVIEWIR